MSSQGYNILIVEDNSVQSLMFKRFAEQGNYQVDDIVDRGERAIARTSELDPDLIIMDIFLNGDMNGIEAMDAIRSSGNDVPVIYVSGNSDPYYAQKAKKTTYSKFLFKPVDENQLLKAIKSFLNKEVRSSKSRMRSTSKWLWPFSLFF